VGWTIVGAAARVQWTACADRGRRRYFCCSFLLGLLLLHSMSMFQQQQRRPHDARRGAGLRHQAALAPAGLVAPRSTRLGGG
jgi:hypothetical protein